MNPRTFSPSSARRLDDPERLVWLPPAGLLSLLALPPDAIVADVGAGTGYFSLPLARAVGERGRVLALDLQAGMLGYLREKLQAQGAPENIHIAVSAAAPLPLEAASLDLVLLANLWHELDGRARVLEEAARVLKPGGRLAILDWRQDLDGPPGPPRLHRVAQSEVEAQLVASAWRLEWAGGFGTYGYLLLASRS